jgi:hypothetical protein
MPERVHAVVQAVLAEDPQAEALARNPVERACLANIAATRAMLAHQRLTGAAPPLPRLLSISRELDPIAVVQWSSRWSSIEWLNHLMLRQVQPSRRSAVVVSMRDEGLLVLEFIAHYRALGFAHIFIYSNANNDGSDALLRRLAEHGAITFIDNEVFPPYHPQGKAYAHSLNLLPELRLFEWVFFIDADEFFVPAPRHELEIDNVLQEIAQRFPGRAPAAICYQWRWYVSGYRYRYDPDLLLRRFRHANDHELSKCLVRPAAVTEMCRLHFPSLADDEFLVNSAFDTVPESEIWTSRPPVYDGGQLNHYWTKSFEEFSVKKARNPKTSDQGGHTPRDFSLFFNWNGSETPGNLHPAPSELVAKVEAELQWLKSLPDVDDLASDIRARLPILLARFDDEGGLSHIYESTDPRRARMQPPMSDAELALYETLLRSSSNYVEFGSSGSTAVACRLVSTSVISVDSSPAWQLQVARFCRAQHTRLQPNCILADIGPVREFGYPEDDSTRALWANYHTAVWSTPGVSNADAYLIDGRFRVACFLQTLLHARPDALVMIHDFSSRPQYHVIREFAREIAATDQLSVFQRRIDFDTTRAAACLASHADTPE